MQLQATSELNVLSPWADADPVPLSGISERLESLQGKTIGLFCNSKRAARPMLEAVENYISDHYPDTKTSWYVYSIPNVPEMESPNKDKFRQWLATVDGVVLAVGD
jgi:hypothetical protein